MKLHLNFENLFFKKKLQHRDQDMLRDMLQSQDELFFVLALY